MDALTTCMYNGLYGTPYGGRLNRHDMYRESLVTIARAGVPIYCFVPQAEVEAQQRYFDAHSTPIRLIPLELTDIPHHADIQRIKAASPAQYSEEHAWQERCVEIMWGKFHMLERVIALAPDAGNVYWIDAGLANANIISTKYISWADLHTRRLAEVGAAFPPQLFARMREFAGDAVLVLRMTQGHHAGIPEKYNALPYATEHFFVAGLFGGPRPRVAELCAAFADKAAALIADDVLYFEESILAGLFADRPELFRPYTFDAWYHEGWSCHDPGMSNFSNFFDDMLETPPPANELKFPW